MGEGFVSINVVVYLDGDFDPDQCTACNVENINDITGDSKFCAYSIEIPCDQEEVECGEPSAAPSGSYFPSSAPSDAPTKSPAPSDSPSGSPSASPSGSPTGSPSESPTGSPSAYPSGSPSGSPSDSPTASPSASPSESPRQECPEGQAELMGNDGETMYADLPIEIREANGTHVTFVVENTFRESASSIFTQYHSGSFGETECIEEENVEPTTKTDEYVGLCMHHTQISIVTIWITECNATEISFLTDSDDAEIPECCHPGEECRTVQYEFKLPCVPCPEDEEDADATDEVGRRNLRAEANVDGTTKEFEDLTGHPEPNSNTDHFCVIEDYPCGPDGDKVHVCHYSARDGYKTFLCRN